jgi:hypothetical protein
LPVSLAEVLLGAGLASGLFELSPVDPEPLSVPDPASAPPSEPEPAASDPELDPPSAEAEAALDAERAAVLRSFFAQPLPRKWIVGAEKALRTGAAPQIGQTVGPSAVTEWMTSKRWPFGQR